MKHSNAKTEGKNILSNENSSQVLFQFFINNNNIFFAFSNTVNNVKEIWILSGKNKSPYSRIILLDFLLKISFFPNKWQNVLGDKEKSKISNRFGLVSLIFV